MRVRPFLAALAGCLLLVAVALPAAPADGRPDDNPLDDPTRPESDRARDAGSKPLEVYAFFGIEEGMTVADIIPSRGYNSHILAHVVGPEGEVICAYTNDQGKAALEARFAEAGFGNTEVVQSLASVPDASVDVHVTVRNIHDLFIPSIVERFGLDPEAMFADIRRTLKPGGILGVVDARTSTEGVDEETHRINEQMVIDELEARGFELVDSSDLLAVPGDDHAAASFPDRWTIDRMVLKFRKSAG